MTTVRGLEIGRTLDDFCRPDRMALVVYDMQVGIVSQLDHGPEIVARVAAVLEAARAGGFRVVFMRHLSMPPELMGAFQYRQAMAWTSCPSRPSGSTSIRNDGPRESSATWPGPAAHGFFRQTATGVASLAGWACRVTQPTVLTPSATDTDGTTAAPVQ